MIGAEMVQRQLHNQNPPQHGWQLIKAENLRLSSQLVGSLTGWRIAHPRRSIVWFSVWGKKIFIHLCPRTETHLYIFIIFILPSLPGLLALFFILPFPFSVFSSFLFSPFFLYSISSPPHSPSLFFFFVLLLPIPPVLFILSFHLLSL